MEIEIQLTNGPILPQCSAPTRWVGVGAWVEFRGLVRGEENRDVIAELAGGQPCLFVRVIHRIAIVPVGEAAIYVGIAARHRAEAFGLLTEFMNRLKQNVPIWNRRALAAAELAELKTK